ncbi:t-complex 1 subunit beta [Fusarium heterosporum]|uniref:T-complex 1 subunit beta n=1 Tax=Fusarium heterosporum TaxID=42747 RepID=A0A8H5WXI2_FUSHE|nr:t-complex 1 subunit beta [Fusarium heterosporum]
MGQPTIPDFFPSSSPSRRRAKKRQNSPVRKLKPKTSQTSSLPSIPSTPIPETMSSQSVKKRPHEEGAERILETPSHPNKRFAKSSQGQRTPTRATELPQGSSPHTPLNISSGESSDSDCQIQRVESSPNRKRKLVAASPRARHAKKTKVEQPSAIQRGFASIKASALAPDTAPSKAKRSAARRCRTASVPPSALLPDLTSSFAVSGRSSSVPPKSATAEANKMTESKPGPQKGTTLQRNSIPQKNSTPQQDTTPQNDNENESDCCIEIVSPSPKRRQQLEQQKANVKRRRVGDSVDTPVFLDADHTDELVESDLEIVKVQLSPKRRAAAIRASPGSKTEDRDSQTQRSRKIATLPKLQSPVKLQAPIKQKPMSPASTIVHSPIPSQVAQNPHIDLTQEPSSDSSDTSDEEFITPHTQPTLPTPVQNASNTQNEPRNKPETVPEDRHGDNLGPLMNYCDHYLAKKKNKKQDLSSSDEGTESPAKTENSSTLRKLFSIIKDEAADDDSEEEYQGLSDRSDDDYDFKSSPPVSYQLPEDEAPGSMKAYPPLSVSKLQRRLSSSPSKSTGSPGYDNSFSTAPELPYDDSPVRRVKLKFCHDDKFKSVKQESSQSSAYKLQSVYSGKKLPPTHTPGTPSPYRPHHRDALIGLKSILRRSGGHRDHDTDNETEYSPFPDISPLSGDEYTNESGIGNKPRTPPPSTGNASKPKTLTDLRSKSWVSPRPKVINRPATPVPKGPQWLQHKKEIAPLTAVVDDITTNDAASSQGTPSKRPVRAIQRPSKAKNHYFTDVEESEDELQKRYEEQQLKPIKNSNWFKPSAKEIKPQVIRDSVSEHAIKSTVTLFKKKMDADESFCPVNSNTNQKYCWDVDWSIPASLSERESHAVATELDHRGIKTDKQYSNFWYNLTMKCSKLLGSPVPLFTAKTKALDTFVEEATRNHEFRTRGQDLKVRKALRKKLQKHKKKNKLPEGVEAFLIPGDTDQESDSEDSDTEDDLIGKMHAEIEKQKKISGRGTSCGRRRKK